MAKKRRKEPEESGSGYSWMDTYGDMVTLLLCFFVLLYSFSTVDAEKWQELVGAFTGTSSPSAIQSLDVSSAREDPIGIIDPMIDYANRQDNIDQNNQQGEFDQLYENIKLYISENGLGQQLSVERTDEVIILRFGEVFLFESGKADLLASSNSTLENIIEIIAQNKAAVKQITIEGHTDNVPIHNAEFSDNWDLSVTRAVNTLRRVASYNVIQADKLAAMGFAEYQPIATNSTPAGRAKNRRVDFIIQRMSENN